MKSIIFQSCLGALIVFLVDYFWINADDFGLSLYSAVIVFLAMVFFGWRKLKRLSKNDSHEDSQK